MNNVILHIKGWLLCWTLQGWRCKSQHLAYKKTTNRLQSTSLYTMLWVAFGETNLPDNKHKMHHPKFTGFNTNSKQPRKAVCLSELRHVYIRYQAEQDSAGSTTRPQLYLRTYKKGRTEPLAPPENKPGQERSMKKMGGGAVTLLPPRLPSHEET